MAEIVNLRRARKAKARDEDAKQADANRAKFGRTKVERTKAENETQRLVRTVDRAKLDKRD